MKHQGMRKLMALLLAAVLVLPCVLFAFWAQSQDNNRGRGDYSGGFCVRRLY